MKRILGVVVALLCLGVMVAILLARLAPVRPTINFSGFRQTSEGRVAVFRATNSSSRPVAYRGKSVSEPYLWYVVSDGKQWKIHGRNRPGGASAYWSGTFTLKPQSSVDFIVSAPAATTITPPTRLGWGADVPHPTSSKPPLRDDSFGIVTVFTPGDAAALARGERPIGERIRTALQTAAGNASTSGWIEQNTCDRIVRWLSRAPNVYWVESTPANP